MSETIISSVIICPKCKYTNPGKSKFCMQCGSPLADVVKNEKMAKLVLLDKGKSSQEFIINKKTILGKSGDIDVSGADFSKSICEFSLVGDKLSIKILQDGVFLKVNSGNTLELETGSELKIGDRIFRVEI